ncbi:hypothetical protein [Phaeobacter sp. J2-8]|uniref:hypothetical protein n=1 Tax=Phaeobacter sp. J2-8 TaxID=2931394 RepID=UPI001FD5F8AA|nr:hypothetical protein [Phaeobacter sp. J2-8]MCJ7874885.1 hypothetical protein [Phaeobacter sp. J2-8]
MKPMRLARSASLRLTLAIAGLVLFMALLAMAVQYRTASLALERQQDALLKSDIDSFAELYDQRRIPALRQAIVDRAAQTSQGQALYLLQDRDGTTLAGNIADWPRDLPAMAWRRQRRCAAHLHASCRWGGIQWCGAGAAGGLSAAGGAGQYADL